MARAAYRSTCTVSMPDSSEKNQPQLVNMSSDWRCSSSRRSARMACSGGSSRPASRRRKASASRRSGSSTSSTYRSRVSQGARKRCDASRS